MPVRHQQRVAHDPQGCVGPERGACVGDSLHALRFSRVDNGARSRADGARSARFHPSVRQRADRVGRDALVRSPRHRAEYALLPGPKGTYTPDRFSAVRVELRSGRPDVESTGPHELVWLVGKPGTPDVLLAWTDR